MKPLGTCRPARSSSPRFAPLPPARTMELLSTSSNHTTALLLFSICGVPLLPELLSTEIPGERPGKRHLLGRLPSCASHCSHLAAACRDYGQKHLLQDNQFKGKPAQL